MDSLFLLCDKFIGVNLPVPLNKKLQWLESDVETYAVNEQSALIVQI